MDFNNTTYIICSSISPCSGCCQTPVYVQTWGVGDPAFFLTNTTSFPWPPSIRPLHTSAVPPTSFSLSHDSETCTKWLQFWCTGNFSSTANSNDLGACFHSLTDSLENGTSVHPRMRFSRFKGVGWADEGRIPTRVTRVTKHNRYICRFISLQADTTGRRHEPKLHAEKGGTSIA